MLQHSLWCVSYSVTCDVSEIQRSRHIVRSHCQSWRMSWVTKVPWFIVIHDDLWRSTMIHDRSGQLGWSMMTHDDSRWCMTTHYWSWCVLFLHTCWFASRRWSTAQSQSNASATRMCAENYTSTTHMLVVNAMCREAPNETSKWAPPPPNPPIQL